MSKVTVAQAGVQIAEKGNRLLNKFKIVILLVTVIATLCFTAFILAMGYRGGMRKIRSLEETKERLENRVAELKKDIIQEQP